MYQAKGLGPAAGNGWYTADKDEPICETMERLGTLPFVAQPGQAFVYGYNTDILGCIVGESLRDVARGVRSKADHRPARNEGHPLLRPAGGARTPGRRIRERSRRF